MAELGLEAYRFSVAWARVLPEGHGRPDTRGLGFYDRLVDGLLERGITPWLTLYHWDLPQALEDVGGWRVRATVGRFTDYASLMAGTLGDRVTNWITHNEPWVASMLGHRDGVFAPGRHRHARGAHGRASPAREPRHRRTGDPRRGSDRARRDRDRLPAGRARERPRGGRRSDTTLRRLPQPLVPRPAVRARLPRGHGRCLPRERPLRRDRRGRRSGARR
jgi:hypothetical protein